MNTPAAAPTAPGPRDSAALAQLVGEALTRAQGHADTEDAAEIRAITDAMVRLLIGAPLHSDGKLTVVSLAAEAGLRRSKLTHKHTGLKDLIYALVKARTPVTDAPDSARVRAAKQQQDLARVRAERDDLREARGPPWNVTAAFRAGRRAAPGKPPSFTRSGGSPPVRRPPPACSVNMSG